MIDDDDDFLPNMDFPALEDKLNIFKSGNKFLAMIEKKDYDPAKGRLLLNLEKPRLLGLQTRNNEQVGNPLLAEGNLAHLLEI